MDDYDEEEGEDDFINDDEEELEYDMEELGEEEIENLDENEKDKRLRSSLFISITQLFPKIHYYFHFQQIKYSL